MTRYTLEAGRCICIDGKPAITLHRVRAEHADSIPPDEADALARRIVGLLNATAPSPCKWWLNCKNDATTTRDHPILGSVPICARCDAKVDSLESKTRKGSK